METKRGERTRTLAQRKPDGIAADESGGGETSEKSASGLGQGQREKAIADLTAEEKIAYDPKLEDWILERL